MAQSIGARPGRGKRPAPRANAFRIPGGPPTLVAVLAGLYTVLFLIASKARLDRFAFRDQDLALHAQSFWALLHGTTRISVLGISFLGNHLHAFTFLLAPFYLLCPNAYFPLAVQTLALAAGAFPLYRIAERRLGSGLGVAVTAAYLISPALGYVNFSEFHMPALVVPLLFWAHDAYETDRRNRLVVLLIAIALLQENFPLFGVVYGVLLAMKRPDFVRGSLLAVGCLVYFYVGFEVLLPLFRKRAAGDPSLLRARSAGYYPQLGHSIPELIAGFARNPIAVVTRVYEARKGLWLAHLLLPLALMPLAGAEWLVPAVPYFLQHFLSARLNETSIKSHYAAELLPFLLIATVVGLARIKRLLPSRIGAALLAGVLLAAAIAGNIALGCQLFLVKDILHAHQVPPDPLRKHLLSRIPPDAPAVASFDVLPHLVNRHELHTLDHVARGTYTMSNRIYTLPASTRYALIDWTDDVTFRTYESGLLDQNLARAFADGSWRVLEAQGSITLLERVNPASEPSSGRVAGAGGGGESFVMPKRPFAEQPQLFQIVASPPPGFAGPRVLFDGALELLDASVVSAPPEEGERIRVGLVWRLRAAAPGQYVVKVEIIDTAGRVRASADHPLCYNIYPPTRWALGEIVREDVWLPVTSPIGSGDYGVTVRADAFRIPRAVAFEKLSGDVVMVKNRPVVRAWKVP